MFVYTVLTFPGLICVTVIGCQDLVRMRAHDSGLQFVSQELSSSPVGVQSLNTNELCRKTEARLSLATRLETVLSLSPEPRLRTP